MPSFTKERENELKCMYPTVLHLTMLGGGGGGNIRDDTYSSKSD